MSSQGEQILPGLEDPKYVDLVRKITEKTRGKKIVWNKTPTGMSASVSGKIHFGFVRSSASFLTREKWGLFTIRDERGNEILSVTNTPYPPDIAAAMDLAPSPEPSLTSLRNAVGDLFDAVEEIGRAEVEKLIEVIDKI